MMGLAHRPGSGGVGHASTFIPSTEVWRLMRPWSLTAGVDSEQAAPGAEGVTVGSGSASGAAVSGSSTQPGAGPQAARVSRAALAVRQKRWGIVHLESATG